MKESNNDFEALDELLCDPKLLKNIPLLAIVKGLSEVLSQPEHGQSVLDEARYQIHLALEMASQGYVIKKDFVQKQGLHRSKLVLLPPAENLRQQAETDLENSINILAFLGLLERDDDGTLFYRSKYDGSKNIDTANLRDLEVSDDAEDFRGEIFKVPSLYNILSSMTHQEREVLQQYWDQGLAPKLQLTPLAISIDELRKRIEEKMGEINKQAGEELLKEISLSQHVHEDQLMYEPEYTFSEKKSADFVAKKGMNKSQLICHYNGWLVGFIPQKQDNEAELSPDQANSEKAANFMDKLKESGESSLGYEDYLMLCLHRILTGKAESLAGRTFLLPESETHLYEADVASGQFNNGNINLSREMSNQRENTSLLRGLRVKVK